MTQLTHIALGPYRVLSPLGAGGMSEVYRAFDPRLEREVAIKVLSPTLAGQTGFLERFRREARAAARLDHPNILPIFDFGEERGVTYVVMPLIEGGTLRERLLERGVCSLRESLRILTQVALALHEAHQHGLVHRDVKPANILLAPNGRALLADFGIACAIADTHDMGLTQNGMGIGTPEYMSPEQARGEVIDHRADVYALGIVLFQVLTGQVPFSDEDGLAIAHQQIYAQPPAPRRLNPTIPPAVEEVMLQALAKVPGERFQSAAAFAAALEEAAPWLYRSGHKRHDSAPHPALARRRVPITPRLADHSDQWGASGPLKAGDTPQSTWEALSENDVLTAPRAALRVSGAVPRRLTHAEGARRRASHRWAAWMAALFVLLLVGAGLLEALRGLPLPHFVALSPPTPAASTPATQPSATPVPATVYMAQFFQLTQNDLLPGDALAASTDIPNARYEQQEGAAGMLYQGGTAIQFGRAFGTGALIVDLGGTLRFVVLVDRFQTLQDAQRYFAAQAGRLSQTMPVVVGEQAVAGLVPGAIGQASVRLLVRDRNILLTFASAPSQTPLAFQRYFQMLAKTLTQRGERCQFTLKLTPVPGAPAVCSKP